MLELELVQFYAITVVGPRGLFRHIKGGFRLSIACVIVIAVQNISKISFFTFHNCLTLTLTLKLTQSYTVLVTSYSDTRVLYLVEWFAFMLTQMQ